MLRGCSCATLVFALAQDAEKVRQLRSRLESILNVALRLRFRCFHRLRPCWTAFLSILRGILLLLWTCRLKKHWHVYMIFHSLLVFKAA